MKCLALTFIFRPAVLLIGSWVSSVGIVTWYGLDSLGFKSLWRRFFCICPDQPQGLPSLLYMGYWAPFLGGKLDCGIDDPPLPSANINERVELRVYLYSSFGPSWHGMVRTLLSYLLLYLLSVMWIVFQILNVSAIVLANLCVSYIMTSQNEEAEEMMRKIEKEEEQLAYDDPDKKVFHLCIVNLVIGWDFYQNISSYFMYLCMYDNYIEWMSHHLVRNSALVLVGFWFDFESWNWLPRGY